MPKGKGKSTPGKSKVLEGTRKESLPRNFFVPKSPFLKRSGSPLAVPEYLSDGESEEGDFSLMNSLLISGALEEGLKPVMESLAGLHAKFDALENRVSAIERKERENEGKIETLQRGQDTSSQAILQVQNTLKELVEGGAPTKEWQRKTNQTIGELSRTMEDLDNARRATGMRVLGFHSENRDDELRKEVEDFLVKLMVRKQEDDLGPKPKVMRTYRLPSRSRQEEGAKQGTLIVHLENQWMREAILKEASRRKEIMYMDHRVLLFPDLAYETMLRRKKLGTVRKLLAEKGLQASVQYPSKLRVRRDGEMFVFSDPESAETFLKNLP